MDDVTQQNAALVEEAAAAAESMQEQAQNLAQAVSVFRLQAGEQAAKLQPAVERRAPTRAANVERLPAKAAKADKVVPRAKTGTDDEWQEF
jgi:methyl-accepting chemotaxis protein